MNEVAEHWQRVVFLTLPDGSQPAQEFLESIDSRISIRLGHLIAKIASDSRAAATPSGYWKPMRAELGGVWEIRCTGPGRVHYRLFVLVDRVAQGSADEPRLILLDGARKQNATLLPEKFYVHLEELTSEYWLSLDRRPL